MVLYVPYRTQHCKFPWKLVEVDLLPWTLVEASMKIHGSFHCRWNLELPLLSAFAASTIIFRGSFHELSHTRTCFHLLPRYHKPLAPSARLAKEPTDFRSIYVHRRFHQLPWELP